MDVASESELQQLRREVARLEAENHVLRTDSDSGLVRRLAELDALQRVNNAANSSLQLDQTLSVIVATVAEVTNSDVCTIYLFEQGRLTLGATVGLNPEAVGRVSLRLGEGITGWTAQSGQPLALRDAWQDPRFRYNQQLHEEGFASMLSVPIIYFMTGAKLVGVINIQHREPRDYNPEEVNFLRTVAGQIAFAIENARLYRQTDQALQQRVEELTALRRISNVVARTLDPKEMLAVIVREAGTLSRSDATAIFQIEEEDGRLRIVASEGVDGAVPGPNESSLGDGAIGQAIESGVPAAIEDLSGLDSETDRAVLEAGFRSICCVPLRSRTGTIGGLVLYNREPRAFSEDEVMLLRTFADETAIALENARLYEDARRNLAIKSALLAEMHHRVKNNLQSVASLLSLQARHAKSPDVSEPLRESVMRIRSIAAVHELLSREQIGLTPFGALAKQIVDVAANALIKPGTQVQFEVRGEDVLFASREATTVALILTELISNALLHGLEGCQSGQVELFAGREAGWATIVVRDTGKGLPPGFDPETDGGLGLSIVRTLTQTDLAGAFQVTSDRGCIVSVRFPSPPPFLPRDIGTG